jgi:ribosomal protein L10
MAVFLLENKKNMLLKSKKEEMIKGLENTIKDSESLVFVNFHGLKVSEETKLRKNLRRNFRRKICQRNFHGRNCQDSGQGSSLVQVGLLVEIADATLGTSG